MNEFEPTVNTINPKPFNFRNLNFTELFNSGSLIEFLDDVVILFDGQGNYLQMSEPKQNMLYKPILEIIGKNVDEILPTTEANLFKNSISTCLLKNQTLKIVYSINIDGSEIWYEGKLTPISNQNVLFLGRNITEYKQKEQVLINSELKLKAIFDNTTHAFLLVNSSLNLETYNRKFEYYAENVFPKSSNSPELMLDVFLKDKNIIKYIKKTFDNSNSSYEFEFKMHRKRKWLELQFSPVQEAENEVVGVFISILDITKRKIMEERLQKNKTNLKAMFDSAQRLYHFIDANFKIGSFNKLTKDFFLKYHKINIRKGDSILKYIPKYKVDEFIECINLALTGKKVVKEGWFIEDTNSLYWAEYLYLPVYSEDNSKIIGVAYSILNINEKHNFIKKIEENELKFRYLVENLPMATYLSSAYNVFNIHYISPKILDISGFEPYLFSQGNGFLENLIVPEDREKIVDAKKNISTNNRFFSYEYRILNKNNKVIWIKDEGFIIFDKEGKAIYFQGVIINITKRIKAEMLVLKKQEEIVLKNQELQALNEELKTSNEELKNNEIILRDSKDAFEKIFSQSPDAIIITDENGHIINCNDETLELIKENDKKNIIGKSAFSYIKTTERYKIINAFKNVYLNGATKDIEVVVKSKMQEDLDVEFSLSSIRDGEQGVIRYIAILKDVTQRKKALIALKESEKNLQETNISKDKFFSIIAHDLKNPFNNIIGFSELLLEDYDSYSKSKIKKILGWIYESSNQGFSLLENLLNWSRSQTGRLTCNPETFNIVQAILKEVELLKKTAIKKNIELVLPINDNLYVLADENMMRTVIRNLVSNAIKFTQAGGKVEVNIEKCKLKAELKISVIDNGVGISEEAMYDIFKIDKNTSTLGTDNETGTGLGLILCKEFVEKNNGTLHVKSKSGEGSVFYFLLPLVEVLENNL